jgi:hypothetical protein
VGFPIQPTRPTRPTISALTLRPPLPPRPGSSAANRHITHDVLFIVYPFFPDHSGAATLLARRSRNPPRAQSQCGRFDSRRGTPVRYVRISSPASSPIKKPYTCSIVALGPGRACQRNQAETSASLCCSMCFLPLPGRACSARRSSYVSCRFIQN